MSDLHSLLPLVRRLHDQIREAVVAAYEQRDLTELARVAPEAQDDTIYAIDRLSEERLVAFFAQEMAPVIPIVLISEGLAEGQIVLPTVTSAEEARWGLS
jgi:hypothetical protein